MHMIARPCLVIALPLVPLQENYHERRWLQVPYELCGTIALPAPSAAYVQASELISELYINLFSLAILLSIGFQGFLSFSVIRASPAGLLDHFPLGLSFRGFIH